MIAVTGNHRFRRATLWCAVVAVIASLGAALTALAQNQIVSKIEIHGLQRVDEQAVLIHLQSRVGAPFNPDTVNEDVKSIYKMGFFSSVQDQEEQTPSGTVLIFNVIERPQITSVQFKGMKAVRQTDDKVVAAIKVHSGEIENPLEVKDTINGLTQIYRDKGYLDANISYRHVMYPNNEATGEFDVVEGPKVEITNIEFTGNKAFSSAELRTVMETKTYSKLLSWFLGWGALDQKTLDDDVDRIEAFYYDNGYLNVHVDQPKIERTGNKLTLVIHVDEGPPFHVGHIAVIGNLKFPKSEIRKLITLKPGELFRGSNLQRNVLALSDFYSDRGYAYVNVEPRTRLDQATRRISVTFVVTPGHEVLVDRINISGNTKTADKVIRREMQVQEQEPYSAAAIRDSKARLDRLGFFSDTRITTSPATQPDKINLDVNVTEQNTASFQVAGGFDSFQSLFGNFTLGNTNLFGGGEALILQAQVGFLFQNYSIAYTEPWFLDMPLGVSLQLFDNKSYLLSFDQSSAGFTLNSTYPLTELGIKKIGPFSMKDVSAGLGYSFQSIGITGLNQFTTFEIAKYKGYTQTSEILPSIRRFTVDNPTDPRSGTVLSFDGQIGGLGGGNYFLRAVLHGRYFWSFLKSPTFGTWVLSQGITFGIGENLSSGTGGELPLYERFFPGGTGVVDSVRGYQLYSLGPEITIFNQVGQPISVQNVGGSKELIFSNEITFPILSALGIRGVTFIDAGQSFRISDSLSIDDLQAAAGVGIRWKSPFGPLAVDLAFPLNPRPADQSTVFEIGAGAPL
jgi:outer membrane protein insertion porin family